MNGPLMLAATRVLRKPPPARIGQLTKTLTLPKAYKVKDLAAGFVGAIMGLIFALFLPFSGASLLYGAVIGAAAAIFAVEFQPSPGENLATWAMLEANAARSDTEIINGRRVRVYIGACPTTMRPAGDASIRSFAVPVAPGSVDHRGVPRSAENRNAPPARQYVAEQGHPLP